MTESHGLAGHNDAPDADIAPVVDGLRNLEPLAVKQELDEQQRANQAKGNQVDEAVGIVIAKLPDAPPVNANGQIFRYYAARILPAGTDNPDYVKPHVHQVGQEPYLILEGDGGEMNTGAIVDERVVWDSPRVVLPGEVIVVQEGQVHSLRNTLGTHFDFVFASPDSHLQDRTLENPGGDRMFTDQYDNPVPPHYPSHHDRL